MKQDNKIVQQIIECFKRGNSVYVFGNGGSLADASHFAAEFNGIGPVIALNDSAKITSIGNDSLFLYIFSQQILDLGKKGDLAIGISSSGKSANVLLGLDMAKARKLETLDFPRKGKTTQEVQNYQYSLLHTIFLLVKKGMNE